MTSRYQQRALYAERGGVKTYEGLDPLTGLPVLIYRFSGQAAKGLESLESENIPSVLEVGREGGESRVVVAYAREYRPLVHPMSLPPAVVLLDSARALRDAARVGVRHGDLRPVRFLAGRDRLLVEGFGIPWQPEPSPYRAPEGKPSLAADVFSWAKAMLDLCSGVLSPEVQALLERCLNDDPEERPDAMRLYQELSEALTQRAASAHGSSHTPTLEDELRFETAATPAEPADGADSGPDLDLELGARADRQEKREGEAGANDRDPGNREVIGAWGQEETDPLLFVSDPGLEPPETSQREMRAANQASRRASRVAKYAAPPPADATGDHTRRPTGSPTRSPTESHAAKPPERGFVKTLPPGATYRSGEDSPRPYLRPGALEEYVFEEESRSPRRRRFILLGLLLVAAAVLGLLAYWQQQRNLAGVDAAAGGTYVVTITLEPATAPAATLYVVSSPPGSRWAPGDGIRTLTPQQPSELVLDRSGVWRFQARDTERASEVATIEVPTQREVVLVMPDAAPNAAPDAVPTPASP